MTDRPDLPWWFSGDEASREHDAGDDGAAQQESSDGGSRAGLDWMGMLSGAARMVDWAASAVVEPHGEHRDPAEHPDCMICRTLVLLQDRTGMTAPSSTSPVAADPLREAEPIRWIPVVDGPLPPRG